MFISMVVAQAMRKKESRSVNILTFDIEEWFHILDNDSTRTPDKWNGFESRIQDNTFRILDLLERKRRKATFFCLGWVAKKYPEIIRMLSLRGFEVGSHSDNHQLVYEQTSKEFRKDLDESVKRIEDITSEKVRSYRCPGFSITRENVWALEILTEYGVEIDSSLFPASRAHGGFKGFGDAVPSIIEMKGMKIKEFPISPYKFLGLNVVFSGGGYFRLFPYRLISAMVRRSDYVMTYFHPRDFDPGQAVIDGLSIARRFKSYYGLKSAFAKLERLLDNFEFIDLQTADERIDWDSARKIKLWEP